jgi:hypothetical protein
MRRSAYDRNGDGNCDSPACNGVLLVETSVWPTFFDPIAKRALGDMGIGVSIKRVDPTAFYSKNGPESPGAGSAMTVNSWINDYPNGSAFFPDLFYGPNLQSPEVGAASDFPMLGATAGQLRHWGYAVRSVPSVDEYVEQCAAELAAQDECWARLDKHLMEKVVPWVPLLSEATTTIVPPRVVRYSFDQSTGFPALDQIALNPSAG